MNELALSMLCSAVLSGAIATFKERSTIVWTGLSLVAGPIAVALILCLPSRKIKPAQGSGHPPRSIVDEIDALDNMRQRGIITDAEFHQGKVQVLAWPVSSPIPPALTPQRVWADGRRTWASYQPATRAAFAEFARRHRLHLRWRDDVPLEVVCTFPVQPGLSLEVSLGLEKGTIHCWGEGWDLPAADLHHPDSGLPGDLEEALDALVEGWGRVLIRTAYKASTPFWVSLQVCRDGRWRTIRRRTGLPFPPLWVCRSIANTDIDGSDRADKSGRSEQHSFT